MRTAHVVSIGSEAAASLSPDIQIGYKINIILFMRIWNFSKLIYNFLFVTDMCLMFVMFCYVIGWIRNLHWIHVLILHFSTHSQLQTMLLHNVSGNPNLSFLTEWCFFFFFYEFALIYFYHQFQSEIFIFIKWQAQDYVLPHGDLQESGCHSYANNWVF